MVEPEALGREDAPHGRFGIVGDLFVGRGGDGLLASAVTDRDVAQLDVADGMPLNAGDRTAAGTCLVDQYVMKPHSADRADSFDRHFFGIGARTVGETDEDRRLGAADGDVGNIDVAHGASVDDLKRDGRMAVASRKAEKLRRLVGRGLHCDAADDDVAEAAVGLGAELDGVAVAGDDAVADGDVFAKARRGAFESDAVVVGVSDHVAYCYVMAAVEIKSIVIVVVAVEDGDAVDPHAVAGEIVLHPTA